MLDRTVSPTRFEQLKSMINRPETAEKALGLLGLLGFLFYDAPSQNCVESDNCGTILADMMGTPAARAVLWGCGGLDFALMNAYFATESIRQYKGYDASQLKKSALATMAVLQGVGIGLVSLEMGAPSWEALLIALSTLPNNIYGMIKITREDAPYFASRFMHYKRTIHSHFCQLNSDELRLKHYAYQQELFIERLNQNWLHILKDIQNVKKDVAIETDKLSFVFYRGNHSIGRPEQKYKTANAVASVVKSFVALGLGTLLSYPINKAGVNALDDIVHEPTSSLLLGTLFNASSIYGLYKLTWEGLDGFQKAVFNKLNGKPIAWAELQLQPYLTSLYALVSTGTAILSYAALSSAFDQEYDGPAKDFFMNEVKLGVAVYHLKALFHLYDILSDKFTKDDKKRYLLETEKMVEELSHQPLPDFINLVEHLKNTTGLSSYGIASYSEDAGESFTQPVTLESTATSSASSSEDAKPVHQKTYLQSLYGWFSKRGGSSQDTTRLLGNNASASAGVGYGI